MAIIGIDQSLTATGYCIHNDLVYTCGTIYPKKLKGIERLLYIEEQLLRLINTHYIDNAFMEGYAYAMPSQSHQIGELGGIIKRTLYLSGVSYIPIAPSSVKKFATGKGNTKKEHMMMHILKRWGVECTNSHEADAYALTRIGLVLLNQCNEPLIQAQTDAIEKINETKESWWVNARKEIQQTL